MKERDLRRMIGQLSPLQKVRFIISLYAILLRRRPRRVALYATIAGTFVFPLSLPLLSHAFAAR